MQLRTQLRSLVLLSALFTLGLTGCSDDKTSKPTTRKLWGIFEAQNTGLTIVGEDLQPLVGAKILIGQELDMPFAGNYLVTDSNGHIDLPAGWTGAEPVTIDAANHVRATYFAQEPGDRTYRLRRKTNTTTTQFEVKGITQGHTIQDRDGFIDFSLVIPAMTRNDFLAFDINSVISPQSDIISVLGQEAEVPSNIAFPKQKESYILPVTLDKPDYRIYFAEGGVQKVFAARGRFPFKDVVDKLRNKVPFYDLVNDFTISGGGVKDLNLTKSSTQADLSVKDFDFKSKVNVLAPIIAGDETMMVVGVAHMNEYMIPTDVKLMKSKQKIAISVLDAKASVFSVLKKTKDLESNDEPGSDRLSAVLVPAGAGSAPQFLPIMADPTLDSNGDMLVQKMNPIAGVNPVATYAILAEVRETVQGAQKIQVNSGYWEMYAHNWIEAVNLPKWPEGNQITGKKHWEINLIGSQTVSEVDLGPAMINNATHVTHSSLDF
ncbi:hypothetical protein [Bdellovibrio sp. HCB337]|uniref:hypothetical protein n=1 Tax=Bdellovibrio sp. HCB337 TaxID=3394358 RepID=UPI0039A53D86